MARAKQPSTVDPETVYTVTLNLKGENLSSILEGLPDDFSVEQAVLYRLFRESLPGDFNARHFRDWHAAFEEALSEVRPVKLKKGERLAPIPPLAPQPPAPEPKKKAKVVGTGTRKAVKKK